MAEKHPNIFTKDGYVQRISDTHCYHKTILLSVQGIPYIRAEKSHLEWEARLKALFLILHDGVTTQVAHGFQAQFGKDARIIGLDGAGADLQLLGNL